MNPPLRALALALAFFSLAERTVAAPYTYTEANNFSAQLQRAFSPPPTTVTVSTYKSRITGTNSGSTSRSTSSSDGARSSGGFASPSDSYSWGMPTRQPALGWGPGFVEKPDPDADKIAAARRRTWDLPTPPLADAAKIARYYQSHGVSASRAQEAARSDVTDYLRAKEKRANDAKWAAYDREQLRISQYLAGQKAGRAAFLVELAAVRARALASGGDGTGLGAERAAAQAWLDLAGSTQTWRGTYIEYDPLARREAVFFAARAGVPRGIIAAWGEAKDAGEDTAYWHAQCILIGDIEAITSFYTAAEKNPAAGFAHAVALFERAYEFMPATPSPRDRADLVGAARAQCAYYLATFYTRGSADLPSDPARALAWAKKVPAQPPAAWQEMGRYRRANALKQLEANILTVRAVEQEILAEWETLLSGPEANHARRALYSIYLARNPAFPTSADAAKARALFPDGPDDLDLILQVGDWPAAAKYEALPLNHHFRLPLFFGRLWRERTDGKRDLSRARAALEYALREDTKSHTGRGDAVVALAETQLELGDKVVALRTLEKGTQHFASIDSWRARLRLALGYYRGEFGETDERAGAAQTAILAAATVKLPGHFPGDEEKFVREFEFQRIAAPLLLRFNQLEAVRLGETMPTWDGPADIARRHRENFEASAPRLREIALAGYAPATRLWAMLTLSNYAVPAPADAALAKNFLYQSAAGGDAPAVVVLAQHLHLEAQQARLAPDADAGRLRDQFAEAAAWLEAAWKTGDEGALRSLYAIYHENLGGLGSPQKADEAFKNLALAGDKDAVSTLAERELAALGLNAPASSIAPAARFARLGPLAEAGNSAAQRELALMRFRGEGTEKDASERSQDVLSLLETAAEAGDFPAMLWFTKIVYLGLYHEAGNRDADTLVQDRFQANNFLHAAARNGSPAMRYRAGLLYLNDKGREPECFLGPETASLARARELLEKAHEEGVEAAAAPLAQIAAQLAK